MAHKKDIPHKQALSPKAFRKVLKRIGNLSRAGMAAGNTGDFQTAFRLLADALSYARDLDKICLEAKLLNNIGLLYTMMGKWDTALLNYDKSMNLVTDHYGTDNVLYRTLQKNMAYLFSRGLSMGH